MASWPCRSRASSSVVTEVPMSCAMSTTGPGVDSATTACHDVGLLEQAVAVRPGFVRQPEAEEVQRQPRPPGQVRDHLLVVDTNWTGSRAATGSSGRRPAPSGRTPSRQERSTPICRRRATRPRSRVSPDAPYQRYQCRLMRKSRSALLVTGDCHRGSRHYPCVPTGTGREIKCTEGHTMSAKYQVQSRRHPVGVGRAVLRRRAAAIRSSP